MKIHHFDEEFARKNGLSGMKEFISAIIVGCIGTIIPAILAPLEIISYGVMFLIIIITVITTAILIKKCGVINKSTMSVLIEDNDELYYVMTSPNLRGNIAYDDQIVKELFNLYKNDEIKTNFDTIMYGKPIYVSKILEKDFKSCYKTKYKVKCIKDNKKQGKVIIPRVFPTFFNN